MKRLFSGKDIYNIISPSSKLLLAFSCVLKPCTKLYNYVKEIGTQRADT